MRTHRGGKALIFQMRSILSILASNDVIRDLDPRIDLGSRKLAFLNAFYSLFIVGGQVGLPISLLTMLLTGIATKRHIALMNLMVFCIIYSVANLLMWVCVCS